MKPTHFIFLPWLVGFSLLSITDSFAATSGNVSRLEATFKTRGSSKLPFTGSRVFPSTLSTEPPFNTIGKLLFKRSNGTSGVCTGNIIKPGVVVTSGHCVHSGNGSNTGYSYNFQFYPGYRNGIAPYGIWQDALYRNTTTEWYKSGGKRPNAADYAVIVFPKNTVGKRMGDAATWVAWDNNPAKAIGQHVTVLGYANNLDKGKISHRIDSNLYKGLNNNGVFGSNMGAGSEGSPVFVNFGQPSTGDTAMNQYYNVVIGVVSYSGKASQMKQSVSLFDQRFQDLLNKACDLYYWACQESN